jgi:SAM-dependent methyltransferase
MITGPSFLDDEAFDEVLPRYERERSRHYWTPVAVGERVTAAFRTRGVRRVLDVGCGPGKFCIVAGSLAPGLEVHGMERRPRLVRLGKRLVRDFGVRNVHLTTGDATKTPWAGFEGLYFYNPFSESTFAPEDRFDDLVDHSTMRFGEELLRVKYALTRAARGTLVVTYHGLGGPIPSSYELVAEERAGTDKIRTWAKGPDRATDWVWLETLHQVVRISRTHIRSALARLMCDEPGRSTLS